VASATTSQNSPRVHIAFTTFSNAADTKEEGTSEGTTMAASELKSFRTTELSALESQILKEKVKGLSDLEVALRLFLYEREVRAIVQRLKRRHVNSKTC
jgi:DNA-binding NarL/FixJ family response regulator